MKTNKLLYYQEFYFISDIFFCSLLYKYISRKLLYGNQGALRSLIFCVWEYFFLKVQRTDGCLASALEDDCTA